MLKKLLHLLPISSEDKNNSAGQILNLCEEVIEYRLSAMVVAFSELVCLINEVNTTFRFLEFLKVLFHLSYPAVCQAGAGCFDETITLQDFKGCKDLRIMSRNSGFAYE